jgi:hypothetical protein
LAASPPLLLELLLEAGLVDDVDDDAFVPEDDLEVDEVLVTRGVRYPLVDLRVTGTVRCVQARSASRCLRRNASCRSTDGGMSLPVLRNSVISARRLANSRDVTNW